MCKKTVNPPVVRVKNTTPETSRPGASVRASRTVPFQLTAIEQRGGRRLAALAPVDIRQRAGAISAGRWAVSGLGNDRHSD
ncbi:hypothetical protein [Proteus mirabilis]|uniref:hypothetical protein n=1 Tax=Proteus mirabilis TaxID=584 RepID=UPI001F5CF540|nr:hypothetical protein [Proteus mirabilis]